MAAKRRKKSTRKRQLHGYYQAKRALIEYGNRAIDGRSRAGRELAEWREAIVTDLGGPDALSAQQAALLDLCVRTKVLLDGVDAWLLSQGREPVNRKERRVWPVVRERLQLSDALARYLGQLGLERRKPPPQDLTAYVQATYSDGACE